MGEDLEICSFLEIECQASMKVNLTAGHHLKFMASDVGICDKEGIVIIVSESQLVSGFTSGRALAAT